MATNTTTATKKAASKAVDFDELYKGTVQSFIDGVDKEDCSEEDCKMCSFFDICKYQPAPVKTVKEPRVTKVSDINLTKKQEEAVNFVKGICRINAGAGSGKTLVVALRTVVLLANGVAPETIFLVTFSNAGAEEMRTRIKAIGANFGIAPEVVDAVRIMTFNAFGQDIIKKEYDSFGFPSEPKVIDDEERSIIIADILDKNFVPSLNYAQFTANLGAVKGALVMAKLVFDVIKRGRYGDSDEDLKTIQEELGSNKRFVGVDSIKALVGLYGEYDSRLKAESLVEFADQEVLVQELLRENPFYLNDFGFTHIIVDEFQDSSAWQIEFIKKLTDAPSFESLMVVGDDSQGARRS